MTESSVDKLRASGMCEHGNEPPCQKCSSKEVRSFVETERSRELTGERIQELERQLVEVASFFSDGRIDFFVGGGAGIDLFDGEWNRDHQDFDLIVFGENRGALYDLARKHGYDVTYPEDDGGRRLLLKEEVEDPGQHELFLFRNDERGQSEFEVVFIEADLERIALTEDVTIDRNYFDNPPTFEVGDTAVNLQPPEITLFFKLRDGRRKDLEDALMVWDQLDETQRTNLQKTLDQSGTKFILGDIQTSSAEELIKKAGQRESEVQDHFFDQEVQRMEEELIMEIHDAMDVILDIRQGQNSPEDFIRALVDHFGGYMPEKRDDIKKITDFLFQDPPPDRDAFTQWSMIELNTKDRLNQKALYKFENQKLWTTE